MRLMWALECCNVVLVYMRSCAPFLGVVTSSMVSCKERPVIEENYSLLDCVSN